MPSKILCKTHQAHRFDMSENALCALGYAKSPCIIMNAYSILEIATFQENFIVL